MMFGGLRVIGPLVVLITGAAACSVGSADDSVGFRARPIGATPLTVSESPTPALQVPNYRTSGTYPQVSGGGVDLKAVNSALRRTVLDEQRRYARLALLAESRIPKAVQRKYPGVYRTSPESRLISASTVVVSTLIPLVELFPSGTDGATWLSVTVRVPSGSSVGIVHLFAKPLRGLQALARIIRARVLFTNKCVRKAVGDPVAGAAFADGFKPTARHYQYFALTVSGLAIGFPNGQVAYPGCGRIEAIAPYSTLRPYLTELGKELVSGTRRPQRQP